MGKIVISENTCLLAVNKTSRKKLRCVTMIVQKLLNILHKPSEETALWEHVSDWEDEKHKNTAEQRGKTSNADWKNIHLQDVTRWWDWHFSRWMFNYFTECSKEALHPPPPDEMKEFSVSHNAMIKKGLMRKQLKMKKKRIDSRLDAAGRSTVKYVEWQD